MLITGKGAAIHIMRIMISSSELIKKILPPFFATFLALAIGAIGSFSPLLYALSPEQKSLYEKNILYYDLGCSSSGAVESGTGAPEGTVFPNLDPAAMAEAINKFIKRENPNSKLKGQGETIVAGAENSNINPFLIVAQAYMESQLADPGDYNVRNGNNAFGRTATASQPNFQGAMLWYKWSSVKASVDHTAHENKNAAGGGDIASYLREQYGDILDEGNLDAYIGEYAPDGNEATYVENITRWVKQMANLVNGSAESSGSAGSESFGSTCCAAGGASASDAGLVGNTNGEKAFNYFIGKGLPPEASAGIVGNFMQESGGGTENLDTRASNGTHTGIAQWDNAGRWPSLVEFAKGQNMDPYDLKAQLDYTWEELNEGYTDTLESLKKASTPEDAATEFEATYEISGGSALTERKGNARKIFNKYGSGIAAAGSESGGCSDAVGDANMKQTITVDTPGKFIDMPARYGCGGTKHKIDSRIAAAVAYLILKYDMCITAGLEDGHLSHGAGVAIDVVPKNGSSKNDWKNSTEAAARDIGWFGDGVGDPKGSQNSCANYGSGDYGQCMHATYPDKFPKWMRWLGYNGAYCHGDPWHYYGCSAHLHIGWDTPNGDGTSSSVISQPRESVYTFPAPVPDDLEGLVD